MMGGAQRCQVQFMSLYRCYAINGVSYRGMGNLRIFLLSPSSEISSYIIIMWLTNAYKAILLFFCLYTSKTCLKSTADSQNPTITIHLGEPDVFFLHGEKIHMV